MGILLQFLATKAIAPILGSIILLTMGEHPVSLSKPKVVVKADTIFIAIKVDNGFPKELLEIIKSGTPVTMRLKVEGVNDIYFTHIVHYDLEKRTYSIKLEKSVILTEEEKTITDNEKKMMELISNFSHIYILAEKIPSSKKVTIRASLDPVKLDFLNEEEFDLMTLWDYRSPQRTIEVDLGE